MRLILARTGWLTTALLFAVIFGAGNSSAAMAATVYGVTTTNQLTRFNTATPGTITTVGAITGLQTGENIIGIDFRPANGQLYALGSTSRLYTVNLTTGAATQIGAAGAFTLTGTSFGFDFNPVPDRIRVVSNTGQNLRLNPNDGTLAATDTPLNPGAPAVTAAAYTNNSAGTTTTTLYVIDSTTDTLYLQGSIGGTPTSPNTGTLTPVGLLGVDASDVNGFDIASSDGTAYAALTVGGTSRLYTINLTTGAATQVGAFPAGSLISGIALAFGSPASTTLDFDGDRRTDFAVFRPSDNTWNILRSSNNTLLSTPFGTASIDTLIAGDFDGDLRNDIAVYGVANLAQPAQGAFYSLRSSDNTRFDVAFGLRDDQPVIGDYDGDGRSDFAVVRRTNNQLIWYILNSATNTVRTEQFGFDTDVVAPGDYDGDGRFDLAVRRGTGNQQATFYIAQSTAGFRIVQFGFGSDIIVPGDYDGDGKTDVAVVRQGTQYVWYALQSASNTIYSVQWGAKPFETAQGDYDGDGKTDVGVWNPSNSYFYILRRSNTTLLLQQFGQNGDIPIARVNSY